MKARTCHNALRVGRFPSTKHYRSRDRSRKPLKPHTSKASSIAIFNPRISSFAPMAPPKSWTSCSRKPLTRPQVASRKPTWQTRQRCPFTPAFGGVGGDQRGVGAKGGGGNQAVRQGAARLPPTLNSAAAVSASRSVSATGVPTMSRTNCRSGSPMGPHSSSGAIGDPRECRPPGHESGNRCRGAARQARVSRFADA